MYIIHGLAVSMSYANEFKTYDKNKDNQMDKEELPEAMLKKGYVGLASI